MSESVSDGPAPALAVDLGALGLDAGADILLARALARGGPGARVDVRGSAPDLAVHLPAWCRAKGHSVVRGSTARRAATSATPYPRLSTTRPRSMIRTAAPGIRSSAIPARMTESTRAASAAAGMAGTGA